MTYYLMSFLLSFTLGFLGTFLSYIVKDPDYYNVPKNQAATVMGDTGFYSQLCGLLCDLTIGTVMDLFGRRIPVFVGYMITAGAIIAMPYGTSIYPTFLILR